MPTDNSMTSQHEDFVSLYVRHEPVVLSFVLGIAGKTVDAEVVTQRAPKRCFNLGAVLAKE